MFSGVRVFSMQTALSISPTDRSRLEATIFRPTTPQKHVWRCQIVHLSGDGLGAMSVVAVTCKSKKCVGRWRERFTSEGVDGLLGEKTRPLGIPKTPDIKVAEVIRLTQEPPPHEATHWTLRAMAAQVDLAASTVRAILQSFVAARGYPRASITRGLSAVFPFERFRIR